MRTTERGFAIYEEGLVTDYGDVVSVGQSSSAKKEAVWLRITGNAIIEPGATPKQVGQSATETIACTAAAHCTVEQAKQIHEALRKFLASVAADEYATALEKEFGLAHDHTT